MNKELVIVSSGGVGDLLVCTPTLRELRQVYPQHKIIVYCPYQGHMDVLKNNPNIDSLRYLKVFNLFRYPRHLYYYIMAMLFKKHAFNYTILAFQYISPTFIYKKSVKEVVADMFGIKLKNTQIEIFLTDGEMKNAETRLCSFKYPIIMHVHSRCSVNHHWQREHWISLVNKLPQYTFIQLGLSDEEYIDGAIDWRGKTTLRETFALIKYAKSFIGIDSSLSHVTSAFATPGVVLFGDSSPILWGHDNNINIYKDLNCSPCYDYLRNTPCPYNHECMDLITVEEVKNALIKQINSPLAKEYKQI